jgi:hypothetical protein
MLNPPLGSMKPQIVRRGAVDQQHAEMRIASLGDTEQPLASAHCSAGVIIAEIGVDMSRFETAVT